MDKIKQALLNDPSASYWIKRAINELDARDPVDALNDLKFLTMAIEHKLSAIYTMEALA